MRIAIDQSSRRSSGSRGLRSTASAYRADAPIPPAAPWRVPPARASRMTPTKKNRPRPRPGRSNATRAAKTSAKVAALHARSTRRLGSAAGTAFPSASDASALRPCEGGPRRLAQVRGAILRDVISARLSIRLAVVALLAVAAAVVGLRLGGHHHATALSAPKPPSTPHRHRALARHHAAAIVLTAQNTGRLAEPVQDAAVATTDRRHALVLGGLTAADTSSAAIRRVSASGDAAAGALPGAVHDAAAVALGRSVYLFG